MEKLKRVILLLETSRAFGRELLYGIVKYSRLNGNWVLFRETRGLKSSIPHLKNWRADGIIMRSSVIRSDLTDLKLPTILALHEPNKVEKIPGIVTDSKSIVQIVAEHLISKGLKHFGFCGYDNLAWSMERELFFKNELKENGFNLISYIPPISTTNKSISREEKNMKKWLNQLPKPIGIMACNDDRAQQILEVCRTVGLKVPEEVAIIGVDNDVLLCEISDPPLSSVALNTEQAGYEAAKLLDKMMTNKNMNMENIEDVVVRGTHVVERHSTDLSAIKDNDIVKAVKYIKANVRNKILIKDVVAQTCLGRRTLELRFKKYLHRSINQEISRLRSEIIKQMLIETNLSIYEITSTFDFIGTEHISRYFKKETGLSLKEFRKINKIY